MLKQLEDGRYMRMSIGQTAKPILIIIAVVIAIAFFTATGFAKIEKLWFIFPLSGIRISTLVTAIICFSIVLVLQRKNILKSVYFAILTVIVPMALFEILWYYSASYFNGYELRIMQFAALFGWILLGIREVYRKKPLKISILLYAVFAFTFIIWLGMGFKFNDLNNPSYSLSAEVLNVFSKGALFFAFAFHIGYVRKNEIELCKQGFFKNKQLLRKNRVLGCEEVAL